MVRRSGPPTRANTDGELGRETISAVNSYQAESGLPQGGLTVEIMEKLGVDVGCWLPNEFPEGSHGFRRAFFPGSPLIVASVRLA